MHINGPYVHSTGRLKGRRYVNIIYDDGKKTTMLYSRWLMQETLGRTLDSDETVDHIDEDKTNDALDNLQILTMKANIAKSVMSRPGPEYFEFTCPVCNQPARKLARYVRHNWNMKKAGPFCGRRCAGLAPVAQRHEASGLGPER